MKRLLNKKGFSFVEMIAAIAVLALMGVGLTTGLGAATDTYTDMMFTANAQVLEDSINTAFANTLRYASDVKDNAHFASDEYPSMLLGGHVECNSQGRIMLVADDDTVTEQSSWLLSDKTYTGYKVTDFSLTYASSTGMFNCTYRITDGSHAKTDCGFVYRNIEGSRSN